jgi:hypothetical protein
MVAEDDEGKVGVFRHQRVVFGVNCSPFLLGAVINHHLKQCAPPLQSVAERLRTSFYVDSCVTSVDCEEELRDFVRDATQIMADAKFELRGWKHTTLGEMENEPEILVVLGLLCDTQEDVLFCDVSAVNRPQGKLRRRSILSAAQRVYDPIGFCCPVTLHPKLLLQESLKSKLSWDAEVPKEISEKFMSGRFAYVGLCEDPQVCDAYG